MLIPFALAMLSTISGAADVACNDARLNDLCFVDAEQGWAAGDRGVVWHTDDGGRRWELQPTGVTCPLWSVWFHNARIGWAAGGFTHPFTHTSTGVLLTTQDGGKTWTQNPHVVLPALRRLRFFDVRRGWALGVPSALYPSGVFMTDDGGQHWRPLPGGAAMGWQAADFLDPRVGALAGRGQALAAVRRGEIEVVRPVGPGLASFRRLQLTPPMHGWLVGDGGMVQWTDNLGLSWRDPLGAMPPIARQFDFYAAAVRGANCWIAGAPGTRIFHSPDGGQTWNLYPTGTPLPLHAIWFADDEHGWAAGDLGAILATSDGGRTWQRQRDGGSRAALLGLFAEPRDIPLELVAQLGGNDGYLTVFDVLGRRDIEIPPRDDVPWTERLHEAVVHCGGAATDAAWQFPLRQDGLNLDDRQIVAAWDRANDGRGIEAMQSRIVRQIRLWRPEVILTNHVPDDPADPLPALVRQAVLQAVVQAADPKACPEQIDGMGLEPWSVKKTFSVAPSARRSPGNVDTAQFAPRLGCSLADAATEPRGLLHDRFTLSPAMLGIWPLDGAASEDRQNLFGGIALESGGTSRRPTAQAAMDQLDRRQHVARKRRHIEAILANASRAASSAPLLAQIDDLTRDLDDDTRGHILYQLADRYTRNGQWPLAAETFQTLVQRYPRHALAPQALLWQIRYYSSREAAWRVEHSDGQKRFERAAALGAEIERARPEWFAHPQVAFSLAAAYRGLGQFRLAERFYQVQSHGGNRDAWPACAQDELQMLNPAGRLTKPVLKCIKADSKPHLDGRLDDPVWKTAEPADLRSLQHDDGDWPAAAMLAYDAEFLYLAAQCRSTLPDDAPAVEKNSPRPRDADLSRSDRVEIMLDIDRAYGVFYRLSIDRRGWTHDSCWDDATWDPRWFVAAQREGKTWTVEAAIPLSELVDRPPQPHDVWAVGIQRVAPGVGFQSWSTPASVSVLPDGFGFLAFQ